MANNISVALATFNGSKYIKEQIFSIINQTLPPNEIIIVDDNSTDNTYEILKEIQKNYPFVFLYKNEENIGPVKTFKKAIAYCNYDYVSLCDQDDIWEENKIEISFNELQKMDIDKPSVVFTDLEMIDSDGISFGTSFWNAQGYDITRTKFRHLLIGNIVTGCTILMNARMKEEIVRMPENVIMHDHWIALIIYSIGNFKAIPHSTIKFRVHQHNVTSKSKMTLIERIKYFSEVFFDNNNSYMSKNIIQAESFKIVYGSILSKEKLIELNNFIELKYKNPLFKKLYIGYQKYILR